MQEDLKNQRFGKLVAVEYAGYKNGRTYWLCKCDCGNTKTIMAHSLKSGKTQSCGCIHKRQLIDRNKKHNMSKLKLYNRWKTIKARCYNPKVQAYKNYGGRGITMCDEWKNDFQLFYKWAINNGYQENLTIDRINNNGNYEPNNCRWTTMAEQNKNKRR